MKIPGGDNSGICKALLRFLRGHAALKWIKSFVDASRFRVVEVVIREFRSMTPALPTCFYTSKQQKTAQPGVAKPLIYCLVWLRG